MRKCDPSPPAPIPTCTHPHFSGGVNTLLTASSPKKVLYLIEQPVVEASVYPVDTHVSEEEEGQHAEEDSRPA